MSEGLNPIVLDKGFDLEAGRRLCFRSDWLLKALDKRSETLRHGNLASWEPEVALLNQNISDVVDILREFVIVLNITMNQKEQGVALPPNGVAAPSDAA